jgi:hypothetical protein
MSTIKVLTVEEILNVLSNWNIRHVHQIDGGRTAGVTITEDRTIQIAEDLFDAYKKHTLIHELLHASDTNRGYKTTEKETDERTKMNYRRIYKHKFI